MRWFGLQLVISDAEIRRYCLSQAFLLSFNGLAHHTLLTCSPPLAAQWKGASCVEVNTPKLLHKNMACCDSGFNIGIYYSELLVVKKADVSSSGLYIT